jgi:ELWxxDGT repeat protein
MASGNLTNVNGELSFAADDGVHGTELWKSDGTAAGTTLVQDIHPRLHPSRPRIGNGHMPSADFRCRPFRGYSTRLPA